MKTIKDLYTESEKFIQLFDSFASKHSLVGRAKADHICYRCESKESFENLREMMESESEFIYQSIISNRRIAIIRFKQGIETSLGTINFLELSDQKPDNSQNEGFQHIEVYPIGWTYEDMVKELEVSEKVIKNERPHHTTHDIDLGDDFLFCCTEGPLMEKIKNSEINL